MITSVNLPTPTSALVIAAHPDDAEFDCGATLAKWAFAGAAVHYLICTDGSKGTWDLTAEQAELVAVRRAEQAAAAKTLGATGELVFLDQTDGELTSSLSLRAEVARTIRRLTPQVVLGHDPWKRYRLHPDHAAAGRLAVEGCVAARDPFFFADQMSGPAALAHHRPDWLLLFEADEPNHAEDVSACAPGTGEAEADFAATQIAALLEHTSQFVTTHEIDDSTDPAQLERFAQRIRSQLAENSQLTGQQFAYAELFHKISL